MLRENHNKRNQDVCQLHNRRLKFRYKAVTSHTLNYRGVVRVIFCDCVYHSDNKPDIYIYYNQHYAHDWSGIKSHYLKPLKTTYYLLHVSIPIGSSSGRTVPY